MKTIHILILALFTVTATAVFAADEIHFTINTNNSVTFNWRGTALEDSIGYGLAPGAYTIIKAKAPSPSPTSSKGPFWQATLPGLKPNTVYYYSIANGPERLFRSPPVPGSSGFTVYAQGDIGNTSAYFNTGVNQDLIASGRPAFVLALGDLSLASGIGSLAVDQHFNDVMTWSRESAYMPVWGDQDWPKSAFDNFSNYKGRFDLPNPQVSPGSPLAGGKDWYWFDYGNTRFIGLPEPWAGALASWKVQATALMAEAQADPSIKFIVTMGHRPAYSSGHFPGLSALKGVLDGLGELYSKYKLNLNAHSRNYERSHPQHGVVHITAGIGGADLLQDGTCLWLTCAKPAWSAYRAMHHGALKLQFLAESIKGTFVCGAEGGGKNDVKCVRGSALDSFTIATESLAQASAAKTTSAAAANVAKTAAAAPIATAAASAQSSAPTVPTGLKAVFISRSQVNLVWKASKDNDGIAGYRIYRNGSQIGTTSTTIFISRGLSAGTAYNFAVAAYDNPGNLSARSSAISASTKSSATPTPSPTPTPTPTPSIAPTPTPDQAPSPLACAPAPTSSLVVNVKDKGAQGNGSNDDTAAIQAAIDAVGGTGGTVLIPDGTYLIDAVKHLSPKSNMTIRMQSGALLKAMPNNQTTYDIFRLDRVTKVNITGGTLQGERDQHQASSGEWGMGISLFFSNNVVVEGVTAKDFWGDGFYVGNGSSGATFCSVTADNNRRDGISITEASGIIVKNSVFKNTNGTLPMNGIQIEPDAGDTSSNIQILNNQTLNNHNKGIELYGGAANASIQNVTISGNTVSGNGVPGQPGSGIQIMVTSGHRITNNTVKNNLQNGISLMGGATNNTVTGNTVTGNGNPSDPFTGIGIDMFDRSTNNTITGNTVMGNRRYNINDDVGGNNISNNTVD